MGICLRKRVPGLVVDLPRRLYFMRCGLSILSIVGADMRHKSLIAPGINPPNSWAYPGSQDGIMALSLLEQGRLAASHMRSNGSLTEALLYTVFLPRFLGLGLVNRLNVLSALKACFGNI